MLKRNLAREEKVLFVLPLVCLLPLLISVIPQNLLGRDLLSKQAEQVSVPQTIDCGTDTYERANFNGNLMSPSNFAQECMAEGLRSGKGFRLRREFQPAIPSHYTGEYRAMAVICTPGDTESQHGTPSFSQRAVIIDYRCYYKFGLRYGERARMQPRSECGIDSSQGPNSVVCTWK
jgi:hypothetical protein